MKVIKVLAFFVAIQSSNFDKVSGANILAIFQDPSYSHEFTYHKILKALAERGHHLTIFGAHSFDYGGNPNVTQHVFKDAVENYKKNFNVPYVEQSKMNWLRLLLQYEVRAFYELTKDEISHPEMQKIIKNADRNYKFDLIIMEYYFFNLALLAEIYDCPIISFSASEQTFVNHGLIGNVVNPAICFSSTRFPYLHGQLSFSERISSVAYFVTYHAVFVGIFYKYFLNKISSEHPIKGTEKSSFEVLNDRLSLHIINTSPKIGHDRSLSPYTIQIGFFHVEPPKELTNMEIKNYLDSSTNGVIVMSFGSKIKTADLGVENVEKFLKAFNQTDYNILWKFDEAIVSEKVPCNVRLTKWMPLSDVLAHPNVKVIIHHGGLLTCYEAIAREVPQIIFPLVKDQRANAKLLMHRQVAIELNIHAFDGKELTEAINEAALPKYRVNTRTLKAYAYDEPVDRKELTVFHIEKVIRHKDKKIVKLKRDENSDSFYLNVFDILLSIFIAIISAYFIVKKITK